MKYKVAKARLIIPLIALLCSIMCVSIGFSTWIATGSSSLSRQGNIDADDFLASTNVDCISIIETVGIRYYSGTYESTSINGFVDSDGKYSATNGCISYKAEIDLESARPIISTISSSARIISFF